MLACIDDLIRRKMVGRRRLCWYQRRGTGWPLPALARVCATWPAPLRCQQQGERDYNEPKGTMHGNASPLTLAYTLRAPTLTSCRGEVNGPLSSLIRRSPPNMGNVRSPDAPTGSRLVVLLQPLQHFLAMAAPVGISPTLANAQPHTASRRFGCVRRSSSKAIKAEREHSRQQGFQGLRRSTEGNGERLPHEAAAPRPRRPANEMLASALRLPRSRSSLTRSNSGRHAASTSGSAIQLCPL